jgi:hypothetical protein
MLSRGHFGEAAVTKKRNCGMHKPSYSLMLSRSHFGEAVVTKKGNCGMHKPRTIVLNKVE